MVQSKFYNELIFPPILNQNFDQKIDLIWLKFGRTVRPNLRWKWPNSSGSAEPRFWLFGRSLEFANNCCEKKLTEHR